MKRVFSCSSSPVAAQRWSKRDQKLLEAVERGDVGRVGALASRRAARPAKLNAAGQSALHLAAAKGLTECLTLLLAHGAPADAQNDDGSTALHLATIACQPQCVKVLLQYGADTRHMDGQHRTPLHWAASSGCASSVLLLCAHGAPLDVADAHGQTPLMLAARGNHAAVCAQLLQSGADPDLTDGNKKTALVLAREHGGTEAAAQLLRHGAEERGGHDARPGRSHAHRENGSGGAGDPEPQVPPGCGSSSEEEEEEEKKEEEEEEEERGERGTRRVTVLRQERTQRAPAPSIHQRVQDPARPPPGTSSAAEDEDDEEGPCLAPPAEHAQELARRKAEEEAEPAGAVRSSLAAPGLEQALSRADGTHGRGLGGPRAPQEGAGRGAEAEGRRPGLEQEVQELKERNGSLLGELARLGRERERLREELRALRERDPGAGPAVEAGTRVAAMARALEAKREEATRLRRRLAGQRRELEALRDRLGQGVQDEAGGPRTDACVLRELQRRLEALLRSQHEALQLVAEMEAEEAAGRGGRPGEDGDGGEGPRGEGTGGLSTAPGTRPGEAEAAGGARVLQERLEEARAEARRWEAAAAAERRAKEEAEAREAEREQEARELREKVQGLERTLGRLSARVGELSAALRDREAKTKQLLAEAEALAAAVLAARSDGARLRLQLQVQQKAHRDVVAVYRSHLLSAAQGFMDEAVHGRLLRILRAEERGQDPARH
ncbi:ankyrin repeat domain-containing protein 35 [Anser cygnoides]|uniref:ankyrin repeat domain-containing protein 35 n=1 Tax=Anser cygnoides TaxID=8845 RepID=UPI0034D27B96